MSESSPAAAFDAAPLDAPPTVLSGLGARAADRLATLGIATIRDLLLHLPFRYQDRTRSVPLRELVVGRECLVTARVAAVDIVYGRRRSLLVTLEDDHGRLGVRLFHFSRHQREALRSGLWMRAFGDVRHGPSGREMVHPEYRLHAEQPPPVEGRLAPVYRVTQGLTSKRLAGWIEQGLEALAGASCGHIADPAFPDLFEAIRFLHRPSPAAEEIRAARERVAVDELIGHYVALKRRRALARSAATVPLPPRAQLGRELLTSLGFRLTRAQARVTREVLGDLSKRQPMMRLLQGDVGSGKTVVAAFAAIRAAEHDCQTAVMAPTEILAEQHFETLSEWLTPLGIGVGLLTGRQSAAERRARVEAVRDGRDLVVVGTHALFQASVEFQRLALVVVDEQHRFGVHQRMQLRDKGRLPHQLVMTATPIPRTLTMALYADMDVSTLDELPPGRKPVRTRMAASDRRQEVIEWLARACGGGRQAYWVCTTIGADDAQQQLIVEDAAPDAEPLPEPEGRLVAAEEMYEALSLAMPESVRVGLVHGRLRPADKQAVMAAFRAGSIHLLVATTVIEVGVDVPNATLMVIDNAERLGLAQLHQLRGRVGRGRGQGTCVLLYERPLSEVARARLKTVHETGDGFKIAEKDLELRGPGDVLGTRQTGDQLFKVADLAEHRHLVPRALKEGNRLLAEEPAEAQRIVDTWTRGEARYADV